MASDLEQQIELAQAAVTKQGDSVRALKALAKDGKAEKVAQQQPEQQLAHPCSSHCMLGRRRWMRPSRSCKS
jgi:hypothetical protein